MARRAALALHVALSALGVLLYILFVIPRWWVLTGDFPVTLGAVGRIAAGIPIAAAAVPVMLNLQRAVKPGSATPELALRLRAWSAALHVLAGALILVAAIAEFWLPLSSAGPWLFAVYGAAGAIAILAIAAFYLSFAAEEPPPPPKPPKPSRRGKREEKREELKARKAQKKTRKGRGKAADAAEAQPLQAAEPSDEPSADGSPPDKDVTESGDPEVQPSAVERSESSAVDSPDAEPESEVDTMAVGTATGLSKNLRNKRPTGKTRQRSDR